jgi:hypothetical protein
MVINGRSDPAAIGPPALIPQCSLPDDGLVRQRGSTQAGGLILSRESAISVV